MARRKRQRAEISSERDGGDGEGERERAENAVTGDDLLKLSKAPLQRQLPLLAEFQTGRVTVTHRSTETVCMCSAEKKSSGRCLKISQRRSARPRTSRRRKKLSK